MTIRRSLVTRVTGVALFAAATLPQLAVAGGKIGLFDAQRSASDSSDRLIVKYRALPKRALQPESLSVQRLQTLQNAAARLGVKVSVLRQTALGSQVLKLDRKLSATEAATLIDDLKARDPNIVYVEQDQLLHAQFTPNDPRFPEQWDLYEATGGIRAPEAWDLSTGANTAVAVIDTGYRPHADLVSNIMTGFDFISDTTVSNDGDGRDGDPSDPGDWSEPGECWGSGESSSWHGTHVAGTIAAVTNNAAGIAGIAYGTKIQPLRVLGRCGGYLSDVADAIVWASGGPVPSTPPNSRPAQVANLSLGGWGPCSTTMQDAITAARSRGTVVVVSAGNSSDDTYYATPANCSGVIAVAATGRYGERAYYSNYGDAVALAAPGGDMSGGAANGILSTLNTGTREPGADTYAYYQGTSMAAPHVSAVAALIMAKNPNLTPDQVREKLTTTARPFPGTCNKCGAGILDAYAAVMAAGGGGLVNVAEVEPNNSIAQAQALVQPSKVAGTEATSYDQDWYRVELPAGKTLNALLIAATVTADYDLYVFDAGGNLLAKSELGPGEVDTATVANTTAVSATRYVKVGYYAGGTGSTNGKYSLTVTW